MKKMLLAVLAILAIANIASAAGHMTFVKDELVSAKPDKTKVDNMVVYFPVADFGTTLSEIVHTFKNDGDQAFTWYCTSPDPAISIVPYPAGSGSPTVEPGEFGKMVYILNRPMFAATHVNGDYEYQVEIYYNDGEDHETVTIKVTVEDSSLPVELSDFTAEVAGTVVNLKWTTASESNNLGFHIERSNIDSDNWDDIGFVEGKGTVFTQSDYDFTDENVKAGQWQYRLGQEDTDGKMNYSVERTVIIATPSVFTLSQNYPNPFNPTTTIEYDLNESGFTRLIVFDILGREAAILVGGYQNAGHYSVEFNATNLPSGVYFYRLENTAGVLTNKMILQK